MIEILIGVIVGIIVCIFGMWCFIRGQQNGIQIANKEVPTQINNPITAVAEVINEAKEVQAQSEQDKHFQSLQEQAMNLLRVYQDENEV